MSTPAEALDLADIQELADSLVHAHEQLLRSLIAMRKRHDLTQEAVAERMSVSQPTVAAFERYDANPRLSTIRRYALAVGASIDHSVSDACCSSRDDRFDAVVANAGIVWLNVKKEGAPNWVWRGTPAAAGVGG